MNMRHVIRDEVDNLLGRVRNARLLHRLRIFLFVDLLLMNDIVAKLIIGVLVALINFIFSKVFIFKGVDELRSEVNKAISK